MRIEDGARPEADPPSPTRNAGSEPEMLAGRNPRMVAFGMTRDRKVRKA